MKPHRTFQSSLRLSNLALAAFLAAAIGHVASAESIETAKLRFHLAPDTGQYELTDKESGVTWKSNPFQPRFGEARLDVDGKTAKRKPRSLSDRKVRRWFRGRVRAARRETGCEVARVDPCVRQAVRTLEFAFDADPELSLESVRLLDDALWTSDAEQGYIVVPVREGRLIPADNGLNFNHRFDTYPHAHRTRARERARLASGF